MAAPKIIPALADLTQDIAGPVPVQLLHDWASGEQDLAAAQSLLDPFRIEGTVVASDTAGLSKLTQATDLVEVISLISRPKEIVHALGVEIGGRAIGIWIADNTEMYYPDSVSAESVVEAMWEAQRRIAARNSVRIGMCVHSGFFYEIGGGLYGPDADAVEHLAEDYSRGDEILVTERIRAKLRASAFAFEMRNDLTEIYSPGVLSITKAKGLADLIGDRRNYPHPYTDEFIRMLNAIDDAPSKEAAISDIYARFLRAAAIVFIARDRTQAEKSLSTMMDDLVTNALLEKLVRDGDPGSALVECGGGLAVLVFTDVGDALDFAVGQRRRFEQNGLAVKIGVDYGAILFFESENGRKNLVGDPVNTASKISEDAGRPGRVSITDRAVELLPGKLLSAEPFTTKISNVSISGYWL
jgi:class 3 adenylate cyclase